MTHRRRKSNLWLVALAAAAMAAAALPAAAAAASPPPAPAPATISAGFVPNIIAVGGTTSLSITITNPNASKSLSNVSFDDTLPAGLVVDNPNGQNGTCGSTGVLTADPGSSTISLTGGKLAAATSCTVSADITTNTSGTYTDSTGPVSTTEAGASPSGATASLSVYDNPTVTVTSPKNNAVFKFGQHVRARYTCADAAGAPGIQDCEGDVPDGHDIPTTTVGPQTFTVTAVSADGGTTTTTINYTVLPDNLFKVKKVKGHSGGTVTLNVKLPGRGRVAVVEHDGHTVFASRTYKRGSGGVLKVKLAPSPTGSSLLTAASATGAGDVTTSITITFTPKGGRKHSVTVRGVKVPA